MRQLIDSAVRVISLAVATGFAVSTSTADESQTTPLVNQLHARHATNKELIDQLVTVSEYGVGFHPTAWASGFVAVEDEPSFEGGILGSKKPRVHPAMKELVGRGVRALSDLMDHLSDKRKTGLSISAHGFSGATWHSDEYHSRYREDDRLPLEVNTGKEQYLREDYTLRVGDLCYVAIGQIVNRGLRAVRYQPSGCYVINSPVATPALAEVVKREWGKLSAKEHELSLIADARTPYWAGPPPALARLSFYYPAAAEKTAVPLLARRLYNNDIVWDFIQDELVTQTEADDWRRLIRRFRDQHGPGVTDSIPYWLHWIYWETDFARDAKFLREQEIARDILTEVFPNYDTDNPPLFDAAELGDQVLIVRSVRRLESEKIDDAVHALFLSVRQSGSPVPDELALACAERLRTTDKWPEYASFSAKRIRELKAEAATRKSNNGWQRQIRSKIARYETILKSSDE
jgi:hypothetical protein